MLLWHSILQKRFFCGSIAKEEAQIQLSYDLETDLRNIMGEPGKPETGRYDEFCQAFPNRICQFPTPLTSSTLAATLARSNVMKSESLWSSIELNVKPVCGQ
jgi:hypothetical protein